MLEEQKENENKFVAINGFGEKAWAFILTTFLNVLWVVVCLGGFFTAFIMAQKCYIHQFIPMCWHLAFDPEYHFLWKSLPLWGMAYAFCLGMTAGLLAWNFFGLSHNREGESFKAQFDYFQESIPRFLFLVFRNSLFFGFILAVYFLIVVGVVKLWTKSFLTILVNAALGNGHRFSDIPFELWIWFGLLVFFFVIGCQWKLFWFTKK